MLPQYIFGILELSIDASAAEACFYYFSVYDKIFLIRK
jgi:hypothetical protein